MPTPHEGETREHYLDRCIPIVLDDGTAEDQDQAVAVCSSMYENRGKLAEPDRTLDGPAGEVSIDQGKMSAGCIFAVNTVDRVGDILNIQGIRTENHRKNPQVLFNHKAEKPDDAIGLTLDPDGNYTVVLMENTAHQTTYFCASNLLAEQVFDRVVAGQIRANSIGYKTIKARKNPQTGGRFLDETDLIEVSWVVLGANQDAVRSCLSRDLVCGKSLHPSLRAAFEAQLAPRAKTIVAIGGYTMTKLLETKAAEAAEKKASESTPAAEEKTPHGSQLLTKIHESLAGIVEHCDKEMPQLDNEKTAKAVMKTVEGVVKLYNSVSDHHTACYKDLPALHKIEMEDEEGEKPAGEEKPAEEKPAEEKPAGEKAKESKPEEKGAKDEGEGGEMSMKDLEAEYDAMTPEEQQEFDQEVKALYEEQEQQGYDAQHQLRLARAAAARTGGRCRRFEV